ncbi:MAG TPA: hypothetical protein VI451_16520 [Anaerolineales bacterium]|nr:hypothetical protein [Anaerolineales bacterium]
MSLSRIRFPLLALAILILVFATLAGLMRLGWKVPTINAGWMAAHGPLMLAGFLGTLISIERAVALGQRWMYIGPALSGLGGLVLLAGFPVVAAQILIILGSLGLLSIFGVIVRRHFSLDTVTMVVGAVAWLAGNGVWLSSGRVPFAVPWWAGFLILTIAGERLELGRLSNIPRRVLMGFAGTGGLLIAGWVISLVNFDWGVRVAGVGMLGLAVWLLQYDIARRTVRKPGLTRFIAICMLSGYAWLAVGGVLGMIYGGVTAGAQYDALLHAIFLGFVFSMIFGHATIIFPAILGRMIQFSPRFYLHLLVLHGSLILRLAGDLADSFVMRRWGGLLNGVALLIFLGNTVWAVWRSRNKVTA